MTTFTIIKRFFSPLKWDKKFLTKAIIWFSFWWVDGIFIAYIVKSITKDLQDGNMNAFHFNLILFVYGIILFHTLAYFMFRWGYVDFRVTENLNKTLLPSFFHIENNFYETVWTGRSLSIIQKGIDTWAALLQEIMVFVPVSVVSFIMSIYIIFTINPQYLFVFVALLIAVWFLIHIAQRKWLWYRKIRTELESEYTRQFIRNIMSKFEILQSNKMVKEVDNLNEKLHGILEIEKKKHTFEHITYNIGNIVTNVIRWSLLFLVGTRILLWTANYSDLTLVILIVWYFETGVLNITGIYKKILKRFSNITQLWEFIDNSPKLTNINEWMKFEYKKWAIQVADISFGYHDKSFVFENFSIDISNWRKTAFVWESGGGKTTLVKLLSWYIAPNQWNILIDGQRLSEIRLMDYYRHIGYLTQDPWVFDGTIRENLAYALDSEPTQDQLEMAVRNAKCEFILEFEKGFETEIGERWVRLSGWQKQRLAIAKIMLKNPDIIFLDEPTSALDSFNEEQVNIALHNLFKNKTVIIVAHRLQTVKTADRILLFEKWRVIEDGTHEELVKLGGRYARMLELQGGF